MWKETEAIIFWWIDIWTHLKILWLDNWSEYEFMLNNYWINHKASEQLLEQEF